MSTPTVTRPHVDNFIRWAADGRPLVFSVDLDATCASIAAACGPESTASAAFTAPAVSPVSASTNARARQPARSCRASCGSRIASAPSRLPLIAIDSAMRRSVSGSLPIRSTSA